MFLIFSVLLAALLLRGALTPREAATQLKEQKIKSVLLAKNRLCGDKIHNSQHFVGSSDKVNF